MVDIKVLSTAEWAAANAASVSESDDLYLTLEAGTYRLVRDDLASVTIPQLVAGSIVQATPEIGDTLTVTGSNERGDAGTNYLWQESPNGTTGWANIAGGTTATLDTSSNVTADYYVRRGVSDGAQGTLYTAAVVVAAGVPAKVDPEITSFTFTPSGGGSFPQIDMTVGYSGTRTIRAYVVTVIGDPPSEAQIMALSGAGIVEGASVATAAGVQNLELTGFTSASDGADVHVLVAEDEADPGVSAIEIATSTALDYSPATYQSGSTDATDASTWTLVFDEAIYGTGTPADWAVTSTGDTPAVSAVTVNGTTSVVLTLTTDLPEAGDSLTVSYAGGDLTDEDGLTLADFGPVSVTNGLVAAGPTVTSLGTAGYNDVTTENQPFTFDLSPASVGDEVLIYYGAGQNAAGLTVNSNAAVKVSPSDIGGGGGRGTLFKYTLASGENIAGQNIVVQLGASNGDNDGSIAVALVQGGSILSAAGTVDQGINGNGGAITNDVTPTAATNRIITFVTGNAGNFTNTPGTAPPTYANSTEIMNVTGLSGGSFGMSIAVAEDRTQNVLFSETITGNSVSGQRIAAITVVAQ